MTRLFHPVWLLVLVLPPSFACGTATEVPGVVRLVDAFSEENVTGSAAVTAADDAGGFRFKEPEQPFEAGPGVAVSPSTDGSFAGRSTTDMPIVHAERDTSDDEGDDLLQEIVVRARVSEGTNLSVSFESGETLDFDAVVTRARRFPWQLSTPLVAGDEAQTYTINAAAAASTSIPRSRIRYVLVRPTDVAGATFTLESVDLVFRKEHLAKIPSGISWQGLSESYRETLVTRAPEQARFTVTLPERPMLDLAVGTVEALPVTFSVTVASASGAGGERLLMKRTVSTPDRWEEVTFDLSELGGREVTLSFRLEADADGALGFWGAPAVRDLGAPRAEAPPKRVLLILLDTLRRDHLEAYGYERQTAPSVARLASEGVLFQDAIAQGAWTKVSAPSIVSSTYPTSNGIYEMSHKLPASADTIAEAFRAAGYTTWGASANGFSGKANNLHQGFEVLHERGSFELPEGQARSKTARVLTDRLLDWLDSHRDVPAFIFYHPIDPHSPYEPYRPYDSMFTEPDDAAWFDESSKKVSELVQERERNGRLPHREDIVDAGYDPERYDAYELGWYDGSIRAADVEIGRVLEKLDELGIADDTLVVFLSDHGEEFRDHGGGFHEDNVYGELVNVPFIMRWPERIEPGLVVAETVEMLDVAPTLLQLAGIAVPERMQGDSLVPLVLPGGGERWAAKPAFSEWKRRTDLVEKGGVDAFSIIADGYKLVRNVERPEGTPEFELYDHREDPLDQNDIAAENPEIVERLKQQLEGWHGWATANALPSDEEAMEGLDAEELERLRSLGYVQ